MSIRIIKTNSPLTEAAVLAARDKLRAGGLTDEAAGKLDVGEIVKDIIEQVSNLGDQALIELTAKLDKAELTPDAIRVSKKQIDQARKDADPKFLSLIRKAADNIREYQESIKIQAPDILKRGNRELSVRYGPIDRVGVYVPGGRAIYPSTVLMTVVPALVAGVKEIVLVSPPTCEGDINPMVLALAGELGIEEVYRVGGAQAIAALAYGTETIEPVQKIVGPGNAFVAQAKQQIMGKVGIDSIAGPSEVLIIADEAANPDWLCADMLAQAEHAPGSAILVTTSEKLAQQVANSLDEQLKTLDRAEAASDAIDNYSAIIVVDDIDTACDVANDFATEHLQIVTKDDDAVLSKIRNSGAIFLGSFTPVSLGDYYAGPSHVLPTGGTAKFFGPLSCNDFLKPSSVIKYDEASLLEDAEDVIDFATREGLTAHAKAVEIRKSSKKQ